MTLIANVTNGATISTTWGNAIRDGVLQTTTTAAGFPASPAVGTRVLNTDTTRIWIYTGSATAVGSNPAGWVPNGQITAAGRTGTTLRRLSTGQSIANTTYTQLLFDTEDFDSDGFIAASTGSPAGTITIPTGLDGLYSCSVSTWDGGNTAVRTLQINHGVGTPAGYLYSFNGGIPSTTGGYPTSAGQGYVLAASTILRMVAGDTLKFIYYQSAGAGQTTYSRVHLEMIAP
jgi:hypothetical protein